MGLDQYKLYPSTEMIVYQHIDEYHAYDGMGNDCRGFRDFFNGLGIENHIITRNNRSKDLSILNPNQGIDESDENIHILHYGGSGYPVEYFESRKGRKFLRFHNVTPAHFFLGGNPGVYLSMEKFFLKTILELNSLAKSIELCISDSDYNSRTILEWCNLPCRTVPILRNYKDPSIKKPRDSNTHRSNNEEIHITYVSRFVPNKKIEDIIKLLHTLKRIHSPSYLHLVGNPVSGIDDYFLFLQGLIRELDLDDNVRFHRGVTEEEKYNILSSSDLFLCMSEHEGFGIPLVEAMESGIPVLAYDSSAIEETLKGGGILFREKNYAKIAELILIIKNDSGLRDRILFNQSKAMEYYNHFSWESNLSDIFLGNRIPMRESIAGQ